MATPIVMKKQEWDRIVKWTSPDQEHPETARRREYVTYLNDTSREMTKSWPNSLENVNKRNEEQRQARLDVAEQANNKFYRRYIKRKKEEQERLMYSARDTIFKNKDAPKLLLSAVVETAILKERAEQVKFNRELRKIDVEQKMLDDAETIRKAKEWQALNEQRAKIRRDINKKFQKEIVEQAKESAARKQKEHEEEINMQKVDNMMAAKEIEAIKEFEEQFKMEEKARIYRAMNRAREENEAMRREAAALARMDERLQNVLLKSRARADAKRKQTEAQIRDEKMRVLEAISRKLVSGDAARDAKDQAILDKANKEREAAEDARRQETLDKQERFRQERIQARQQFLRDEAQRVHEEHTMRQWELMNRFKNQEIYEDYQEKLKEENKHKIAVYRDEILRLKKERDERDAREKAETRYFYGDLAKQKLRDADNKLLTHAAALIQEARALGRPELPILKAIDRYCKMYRLYPMPDLPKSLQEHFQRYAPWDGTQPDAGYSEPPAPPPDRGPDHDEPDVPAAQPGVKTDGLQDATKAVSSKPKDSNKEEKVQDYKRQGPANGLQRTGAQTNIFLPPIQVVPCTTPSCTCELKKK